MERRSFLKMAGGGVASAVSAPAVAQPSPVIKWRLASSFAKSLDTIYGAAEILANRVSALTDKKFQIKVFSSGELVPGLQVLDAVQNGTVECGHTASYYYVGKDKTFAFATSLPFGLTARQQNAWMYYGGGLQLMRDFYRKYDVVNFPGGNTGTQMGGWFRKEIKGLADLRGVKFRIAGIGGEIMAKLGAVPQTLAASDIYPALEKGTIDALEWVGPYDDEKLGFYKVAKFYYYPGWWEPGPELDFVVNIKEWQRLPPTFQEAFEAAAAEANIRMLARYDALNPDALLRLIGHGVKIVRYPAEIMQAAQKAAFELYAEESARNPGFAKVFAEWDKFRKKAQRWSSVADYTMESFLYAGASSDRVRR